MRIIAGQRADGTYGLDIGRPGYDIEHTDPILNADLYSFSSKWNRLETILAAGVLIDIDTFPRVEIFKSSDYGIDYLPMIDVHLINRSNGYIEDHGWFKHDLPGEQPAYSSRYRVYGEYGTSGGVNYRSWYLQPIYGYRNALPGRWDIAWVAWRDLDVNS